MDRRIVQHHDRLVGNLTGQSIEEAITSPAFDRVRDGFPHQAHALLQAPQHVDALLMRFATTSPGLATQTPPRLQRRIRAEPGFIEKP
jgi:hypothetical protein